LFCVTIRPFAASLVDGSLDPDDPVVHLDLIHDGDVAISLNEAMAVAKELAAIVQQLDESFPSEAANIRYVGIKTPHATEPDGYWLGLTSAGDLLPFAQIDAAVVGPRRAGRA
jgi:hypothetical protein